MKKPKTIEVDRVVLTIRDNYWVWDVYGPGDELIGSYDNELQNGRQVSSKRGEMEDNFPPQLKELIEMMGDQDHESCNIAERLHEANFTDEEESEVNIFEDE